MNKTASALMASSLVGFGLVCLGPQLSERGQSGVQRRAGVARVGPCGRCERAPRAGLVALSRGASAVALGELVAGSGGLPATRLELRSLLSGRAPEAPILTEAGQGAGVGPVLVVLEEAGDGPRVRALLPLGSEASAAPLAALMTALEGAGPELGGEATRGALVELARLERGELRRAALFDLEAHEGMFGELPVADFDALLATLEGLSGDAPGAASLVGLLAAHKDGPRALEALIDRVTAPRYDKLRDALSRALKGIGGLATAALASRFEATSELAERRRLAELLRAVDVRAARALLSPLVSAGGDPELEAEALLCQLDEPGPEALARARDLVRVALVARAPEPPRSELLLELATRTLDTERSQRAVGARRLLMAAGMLLARAAPAQRAWLEARFERLSDPVARRFLEARLATPWSRFEDAW